jgi:hypothetical protein
VLCTACGAGLQVLIGHRCGKQCASLAREPESEGPNRLDLALCEKATHHCKVGFAPGMQGWFVLRNSVVVECERKPIRSSQ